LELNSGKHKLQITKDGYAAKTIEVDLKDSLYTGIISLA